MFVSAGVYTQQLQLLSKRLARGKWASHPNPLPGVFSRFPQPFLCVYSDTIRSLLCAAGGQASSIIWSSSLLEAAVYGSITPTHVAKKHDRPTAEPGLFLFCIRLRLGIAWTSEGSENLACGTEMIPGTIH